MPAIEYELFMPEKGQERWEPTSHRYSIEDSKKPVNEFLLEQNPSGSQSVIVGLEAPERERSRVIKTTGALLNGAGFTNHEFKTYNSASFSVKISDIEGEAGLLDVLSTLSTNRDMGQGEAVFAVLEKNTARQIAVMELDRMAQENGHLYKPVLGAYKGHVNNYVDMDIRETSYGPLLGIEAMREDGHLAETPDIFTEIQFADRNTMQHVLKALQDEGFKVHSDGVYVAVDKGMDQVATFMAQAGVIPSSLVSAIAAHVRETRPLSTAVFEAAGPVEH